MAFLDISLGQWPGMLDMSVTHQQHLDGSIALFAAPPDPISNPDALQDGVEYLMDGENYLEDL